MLGSTHLDYRLEAFHCGRSYETCSRCLFSLVTSSSTPLKLIQYNLLVQRFVLVFELEDLGMWRPYKESQDRLGSHRVVNRDVEHSVECQEAQSQSPPRV